MCVLGSSIPLTLLPTHCFSCKFVCNGKTVVDSFRVTFRSITWAVKRVKGLLSQGPRKQQCRRKATVIKVLDSSGNGTRSVLCCVYLEHKGHSGLSDWVSTVACQLTSLLVPCTKGHFTALLCQTTLLIATLKPFFFCFLLMIAASQSATVCRPVKF